MGDICAKIVDLEKPDIRDEQEKKMPKIKSKKTLLKRVRITKKGKIIKKNVSVGHLKRKWSSSKKNRKNMLSEQLNRGHIKVIRRLLVSKGRGIK